MQRKVLEIARQQEVKVVQERVKELMLEPFARTLEDYEDALKNMGTGIKVIERSG